MLIKLVGFSDVDFKDKDNGKEIRGVKIHYIREDPLNLYLQGNEADSRFIPDKVARLINFSELLGNMVDADLDFKGRVIYLKNAETFPKVPAI